MRVCLAMLLGGAVLCVPARAEEAPAGRELIRDPHFRQGFEVWAPVPGKKVPGGSLRPDDTAPAPVWGMAQWSSRYPIGDAPAERLAGGGVRFENQGKRVVIAPPGSVDADLVLGVTAAQEYPERARRHGEPWVHLLVEQTVQGSPSLKEMKALRLSLEARLRASEKVATPDYSPNIHAAQSIVYLTVQNLNRKSAGYGDYYWFGVPLYDDRWPFVARGAFGDAGTGKLIYGTPGDLYAKESTHSGKWVTFEGDLLPEVLAGLRAAWEKGFLRDSRDLEDYRIGGINLGWEVPGTFNVEIQFRNLSLRAAE